MEEEDSHNIKEQKDIKDSGINENESGNSLEIQENDNEEFFMGEPNLDITNKIDNDENIINFNKESKEDIVGENEDKYIAMIEGLEDELYIEQYITKSLKKDADFNEQVNKLKTELNNKNNKLEQ